MQDTPATRLAPEFGEDGKRRGRLEGDTDLTEGRWGGNKGRNEGPENERRENWQHRRVEGRRSGRDVAFLLLGFETGK